MTTQENKKREQAKEFCIVLEHNISSMGNRTIERMELTQALNALSIPYYATILHDKFSVVEENEREHYHIVAGFDKIFDKSVVIQMFAKAIDVPEECLSVQRCSSMRSQVRYLIHMESEEKYQFDASEIITNNVDRTTEYLAEYQEPTTTMIGRWLEEGGNRIQLFQMIGLKNYQALSSVINSLTTTLTYETKIEQLEKLVETQRTRIGWLEHLLATKGVNMEELVPESENIEI